MVVIEFRFKAADAANRHVSFSVTPPIDRIQVMLFLATQMEHSELAAWSYDASAGTGDYELIGPAPTIWSEGGSVRFNVDTNAVEVDMPDMQKVAHFFAGEPLPTY